MLLRMAILLKRRPRSRPAIAASLVIQHGFEGLRPREECFALIENYANRRFTEDTMRVARGLPPKVRPTDDVSLAVPLDPSGQDEKKEISDQLRCVADCVLQDCLQKVKNVLTKGMFRYVKLPAQHPTRMTRDEMWQALVDQELLLPAQATGKFKESVLPRVIPPKPLGSVVFFQSGSEDTYPEVHDHATLWKYGVGCAHSEANAMLVISFLDAETAAKKAHDGPRLGPRSGESILEGPGQLQHLREKLL